MKANESHNLTFDDVLLREKRGYTSMVKPVGSLCNMRCRYCYYLDKAALYGNCEPRMDDRLLDSYVRNSIEGNASPTISFVWHGGEPLIAGKAFFRKAMAIQKKYACGKPIENSIQTNGLLLDDEWCRFFRDNNFLVGISIDGPEHIHDAHRLDAGQRGTFSRVMNAVEMMVRNRVEFNTLSTINIHSEGHGLEVYEFLRQFSQFMQFLPVAELLDDGHITSPESDTARIAPWSVTPEGFGKFMCDVFDRWIVEDVGSRYVQLFDTTLANYVGVQGSMCSLSETCGTGLTIEHNGDVYPCDHFVYPEYRLGNIHESRLSDMATSDRQFSFGLKKRESMTSQCRRCRFASLCHGECPKHRFVRDSGGEYGMNYLCEGYRMFFDHSRPYMEYMRDLIRGNQAPMLVMEKARSEINNKSI